MSYSPDHLKEGISRKRDHIDLTFKSQLRKNDKRFYYEPMLGHMDLNKVDISVEFLEKKMSAPLWISSITGGTEKAKLLNQRFAKLAKQFSIGLSLGSCRCLLDEKKFFSDFDVRSILGDELPFFANLGISQIEKLIEKKEISKVTKLIEDLRADGLVVHINPMQEWYQLEGDVIRRNPIDTIKELLSLTNIKVIVKEVGQGFGPKSLQELVKLPLVAIDFGAFGGTNFSMLENLRSQFKKLEDFIYVGHSAEEMVDFINSFSQSMMSEAKCKNFIISGGIHSFLDGHFLMKKLNYTSIYAQASSFLKHALESYESLEQFTWDQIQGLKLAESYLQLACNKKDRL